MLELLQSLFDAIKAPFALFGDIIYYIKYGLSVLWSAVQSVNNAVQSLSGLPPVIVYLAVFALTLGIIRLIINRRSD